MLSCREIVDDADRLIAGELSLSRRVAVRMHLAMCRHCNRYVRQLRLLVGAVPHMHDQADGHEVTKIMDCIHEKERDAH